MKITFVGDVFPANLPYHVGFGVASEFNKHKGFVWQERISDYFIDSDFVVGNLESPLLKDSESHLKSFEGNQNFADFLKDSGINILSIANNHILEKGTEGFNSTVEILQNKGLKVIGTVNNNKPNIEYLSKNNIVAGISAFNAIQDIENPNLYSDFSEEKIIATLNEMKNVDYKILVFHWGNEYVNIPSYEQIKLAYKFIDYGADVIIGHHPHVIQPIKKYKNGLVFYSLGNFLFDMTYTPNVRLGMVADLYLHKPKKIKYNAFPVYLSKNYIPKKQKEEEFNKKLEEFTKRMDMLEAKGEESYTKSYSKEKNRKHTWQRILMKVDLLSSFFKVSRKEKNRIIKHIWRKIKKKTER